MWGIVVLKHLQILSNNYINKHESMFSLCTGHFTTVVQEVWSHKKWVWSVKEMRSKHFTCDCKPSLLA